MVTGEAQVFRGAVDLLILEAAWIGPLHGYGVLRRVGHISHGALVIDLLVEQGWKRLTTIMASALDALPEET